VAHYVNWSEATDLFCTLHGKTKSYCTPESYKPEPVALSQPRRRHVQKRHERGGPDRYVVESLGVAMLDNDGHSWMDLFVANDTEPNRLYRNKGNGTFEDVARTAGVALSEAGVARAGIADEFGNLEGGHEPVRQSVVRERWVDRESSVTRSMLRIRARVPPHGVPPRSCDAE